MNQTNESSKSSEGPRRRDLANRKPVSALHGANEIVYNLDRQLIMICELENGTGHPRGDSFF